MFESKLDLFSSIQFSEARKFAPPVRTLSTRTLTGGYLFFNTKRIEKVSARRGGDLG